MKILKKLSVVLSILFLSSVLFAESIKDYVCIVKPVLTEEDDAHVSGLQESLKNKGYSRYADSIDKWKKGVFGSGFVYIGKDSKPYVVTNLHVMSHFSTAEVLFEDSETGEKRAYSDLTVVAVSDEIDICVLSFADKSVDIKRGLKFRTGKIEDGEEVWTAGFPGFGGEPLWQLGKGNVTNANAYIKELIDPSVSKVIQHSANVDGGNSGGPLLVVDNKASFKYLVVGVNTWKARYREGTNFSIPSAAVKSFVDTAIDGKSLNEEKKEKVISKIARALEEGEKDNNFTMLMKYVSYDLAKKTPASSFIEIMKYGSSNVRGTVTAYFEEDPYEGMRAVAASNILSDFQKKEARDSREYATNLKLIVENGVYRVSSDEWNDKKNYNDKSGSKKTSSRKSGIRYCGFRLEDKWFGIAAGYNKVLDVSVNSEYGFGYVDSQKSDGWFGEMRFGSELLVVSLGLESLGLGGKKQKYLSGSAMLGLPVDFNQFVIRPFVRGNAGMNFDVFKIGYEAGCEFMFGPEDWSVTPGLGVSYGGAWYHENMDKFKANTLKFYGIISF